MNKKMLIILVAAVVLLGGGGAAAFFVIGGKDGEEAPVATGPPGLISMDTFVVNLGGGDDGRFVKVTLQLTLAPEDRAAEIAADPLLTARMRDRILTLLAAKGHEELASPLGKESLRREIKARLKPILDPWEVGDVLFSEFVVQ